MKFFWPTGVVCVVLLAGCAGQQTLVPQVRQAVADGGAKTVTVAPEPLACTRTQCPVLAGSVPVLPPAASMVVKKWCMASTTRLRCSPLLMVSSTLRPSAVYTRIQLRGA